MILIQIYFMNITFKRIEKKLSKKDIKTLYDLLSKRNYSISHEIMPDFEEHKKFVKSNPYRAWYIIYFKEKAVGSFYLSNDNSIGINIEDHQDIECLKEILIFVKNNHSPLKHIKSKRAAKFHIHISPKNSFLKNTLEKLSKKLVQITYLID